MTADEWRQLTLWTVVGELNTVRRLSELLPSSNAQMAIDMLLGVAGYRILKMEKRKMTDLDRRRLEAAAEDLEEALKVLKKPVLGASEVQGYVESALLRVRQVDRSMR